MNTQRWLVVGIVGGIVAILATRPLWAQALQGETPEDLEATEAVAPTPVPFVTPTPGELDEPAADEIPLVPTPLALESTPEAMMEEDGTTTEEVEPSGPFILARGDFAQLDDIHGGEGTATIYQAPDGKLFVRLDPFSVTDAPDLRVALSSHPAPRVQTDLVTVTGFLDLGPLQSNKGAQNYDIPQTVRLEQFQSVVVYDRQFNIIFTTATLER